MKIADIEIEGYKSIKDQHLSPDNLTVLIGKNNSGKSNVIELLDDFRGYFDKDAPGGEWFQSRMHRGESKQIALGFHFILNNEERSRLLNDVSKEYRGTYAEEGWLREMRAYRNIRNQGLENDVLVKIQDEWVSAEELESEEAFTHYFARTAKDLILNSIRSWEFADPFRKPAPHEKPKRIERMDSSGENLVRALETLRSSPRSHVFEKITDAYVDIMANVVDVSIEYDPDTPQSEFTIIIEEQGYEDRFKASEISSGSLEILVLLTRLYSAEDETDLLAIEEPELHLHPGAEKKIFEIISDLADDDGPQVIVSTHSEVFVDHSRVDNIVSVTRDVDSKLRQVETEDDHLELLGYDQSDLVQSDAVVFVEGRSDRVILSQFAKTLGETFEDHGIEIVVGDGDQLKADANSMTNVLNQLRIPYKFILDSDGDDPSEKATRWSSAIGINPAEIWVLEKYCIESYLVSAPEAIARSINEKPEDITEFLDKNQKRNPAGTLDELYDNYLGIQYSKESHGGQIAKHIGENQIDKEIKNLIGEIIQLAGGGK